MKLIIFFILIIGLMYSAAAADILQNPDFESPPSNLTKNSNSTFVLLNENNTIPGWTVEGNVQYVTINPPRNGHGLLLGQDAKINQTFTAHDDLAQYLLTFTLSLGGQNCSNGASLTVSAPDTSSSFSLKQNYTKESWQVYGLRLGNWGNEEPINLVIYSESTTDIDPKSTCWPVIDTLVMEKIGSIPHDKDNILSNGGFELGPAFIDNFNEGVLLDPKLSPLESALQQWAVIGNVKYINSKHYYVPQGDAAIELLLSGATIQTATTLKKDTSFTLQFMLADANDSCVGDFNVGVQAGALAQNVTLPSDGNGSARRYYVDFKGELTTTIISFQSYKTSQREDGVFCGPVIDDVVLRISNAVARRIQFFVLFVALLASFV